ncbi:Ppx/GppA family phosphatase [Nitriliruptoraceae bacterium ZYF776]|nr:Ppx/GppA family phosphatase [Profundirhabdus halotolerans]
MSGPRAAVDVGTNSVRLLVVDADGSRITRELAITRLGQGVDATGRLDDQALARTLATIGGYRDTWRRHGVEDRVRIAATSAVRDAANRDAFFDGVREVAGVDAEVLSGEQEAQLAFAGAVEAVSDVAAPTAVIDVGGGSTELIVGTGERADDGAVQVAGSVSLQLGCVRLTERHLHGDPARGDEVAAARELVVAQLDHADEVLADQGASLHDAAALIGVAGTATTLGALHRGLASYDETHIHGVRIDADALRDLTVQLVAMSAAQRAELGPVQPGREDVLHGGALVLAAVVERYGFAELVVSESDGLDGLAASLA